MSTVEGVTCQLRIEFLDFVSESDRYPFKIERSDYSTDYSFLLSENSEDPVRRRDRLLTISCSFGVNEAQFCALRKTEKGEVKFHEFRFSIRNWLEYWAGENFVSKITWYLVESQNQTYIREYVFFKHSWCISLQVP